MDYETESYNAGYEDALNEDGPNPPSGCDFKSYMRGFDDAMQDFHEFQEKNNGRV